LLSHQELDGVTFEGDRDFDDSSVFKVPAVKVPEFICSLTEVGHLQLRQRFNIDLANLSNLPDCFIRVRAFIINLGYTAR
jgi:hypothetical protein